VACTVYVPVDVIKERLQVQPPSHSPTTATSTSTTTTTIDGSSPQRYYKNGTDALFQILRQEGWYGIYRGYGATLASELLEFVKVVALLAPIPSHVSDCFSWALTLLVFSCRLWSFFRPILCFL
jgi:hypothetical protein